MNRKRIWLGATAFVAATTLAFTTMSADADTAALTLSEAQAALAHIDADQAIVKAYLDSLAVAPTPTATTAPPVTTAPPAPTTEAPTPPPTTVASTPSATAPVNNRLSGMPWSDGVWAMHNATQATHFATWRGKGVDNVAAFTARETFPQIINPWWASSVPSSFNKTRDDFVLGVPLWANNNDMGTDAQWRQLGTNIAAVDPNAWVRLGWEMNCCFSKATNATTWRAQFSRAVTQMKIAAPALRIVFNPNEGVSGNGTIADPRTLFVDGKVDAVGIDAYDWYNPYNSDSNWANHRDKQYGWNFWYDFAQSKGLPFALPEFGLYTGSSASGGDNPKYIKYVYDWLASKATANPGSIAFVTYFNESDPYCKCNLFPTPPNPQGGAEYKARLAALSH